MFAYLDPGSGSLIASAIVGGGAAALVVARSTGSKVTRVFSRKRKSADDSQPSDADQVEGQAANTAPADG
jgi:predicted naringenin-chalcone synthase